MTKNVIVGPTGMRTVLPCAPAAASAQIRQVGTSTRAPAFDRQLHDWILRAQGARVARGRRRAAERPAERASVAVRDRGLQQRRSFGGEYLFGIGSHFEAGVGVGYSQRTVHSVYADLTHPDDAEIEQELKLKQIPVTFTGRFLLLPRGSAVEPYIGGGLVAIRYRYSEVGEFVDDNRDIFPARYVKDGVGRRADGLRRPPRAGRATGRSAAKCAGRKSKARTCSKRGSSATSSTSAAGRRTSRSAFRF